LFIYLILILTNYEFNGHIFFILKNIVFCGITNFLQISVIFLRNNFEFI